MRCPTSIVVSPLLLLLLLLGLCVAAEAQTSVRPQTAGDAGKLAGQYKGDRALL